MKIKAIFSLITILLILFSCKNDKERHAEHEQKEYYTCPMHPSVVSDSPGVCPVCNMSLVKVEKTQELHDEHKGNFISLDKRQQQLAGIETDTIRKNSILPLSKILGSVAIDESQVAIISSRVKGRIEKLYFKSSGEYIRKGNPVYDIYSEELYADEKEFITLSAKIEKDGHTNEFLKALLSASRTKLTLWGLSEKQISILIKNKEASPQMTFYSKVEGYVTDILVKEGMYVEIGMELIRVANLKKVWVEAQVYTNDRIDNDVTFQIVSEAFPNEILIGKLVFNNPSVEAGRKVQLIRIGVDNIKNHLIPGMMVYVSSGKNTKTVLSVPKSAVLQEKMNTVWIKIDDTTFEQRMVNIGTENSRFIEILSGLEIGDIIVTDGAYLINSEFILKKGAVQRHQH